MPKTFLCTIAQLTHQQQAHLECGQRGVQLRQDAEVAAVAVRLKLAVHRHAGLAHEPERVRRRHASQQVGRRVLIVQHLRAPNAARLRLLISTQCLQPHALSGLNVLRTCLFACELNHVSAKPNAIAQSERASREILPHNARGLQNVIYLQLFLTSVRRCLASYSGVADLRGGQRGQLLLDADSRNSHTCLQNGVCSVTQEIAPELKHGYET